MRLSEMGIPLEQIGQPRSQQLPERGLLAEIAVFPAVVQDVSGHFETFPPVRGVRVVDRIPVVEGVADQTAVRLRELLSGVDPRGNRDAEEAAAQPEGALGEAVHAPVAFGGQLPEPFPVYSLSVGPHEHGPVAEDAQSDPLVQEVDPGVDRQEQRLEEGRGAFEMRIFQQRGGRLREDLLQGAFERLRSPAAADGRAEVVVLDRQPLVDDVRVFVEVPFHRGAESFGQPVALFVGPREEAVQIAAGAVFRGGVVGRCGEAFEDDRPDARCGVPFGQLAGYGPLPGEGLPDPFRVETPLELLRAGRLPFGREELLLHEPAQTVPGDGQHALPGGQFVDDRPVGLACRAKRADPLRIVRGLGSQPGAKQ